MWVIGGVAVGLGTLALKPDARTWLRRRLGMEPEDRRWFEEDDAQPAEHEGDEPLDTREARFSLRARLAEEAGGDAEPIAAPPPLAAVPPLPPLPSLEQTPAPLAPASGSTPPVAPAPEPAERSRPEVAETGAAAATAPAADAPAAAAPTARARAEDAPATTPAPAASEPAPAPAFESVPPIGLEAEEAAKTPGEDTSEIEAVPSDEAGPPPSASPPPPPAPPPPPPPTPLRPPTSPASPSTSRPFSGQSASFRSAIDAARERVHGAAREATPDEGEHTEPVDDGS
jgi:hypothetical protein